MLIKLHAWKNSVSLVGKLLKKTTGFEKRQIYRIYMGINVTGYYCKHPYKHDLVLIVENAIFVLNFVLPAKSHL